MPKYKTRQKTFLKIRDVDSSFLTPSERVELGAGVEIAAKLIPAPDTSMKLKLQGDISALGLKFGQEYFIYSPHWDLPIDDPVAQFHASGKVETKKDGIYNSLVKSLYKGKLAQPDVNTCQATCVAMAIGSSDIWGIRERLLDIGGDNGAGDPGVMGILLREKYGDKYEYNPTGSLNDMYEGIKQGAFAITHGYWSGSGHVIAVDGIAPDKENLGVKIRVRDPYSQFNASTWSYDLPDFGYEGYYTSRAFYAACVASTSKNDAARIYRRGELNSNEKAMWLHLIHS